MDIEAAVGAIALGIAETVGLYIAALLVGGGVGAALGILMFGRRYKQRIAALEARIAKRRDDVGQQVNVYVDKSNTVARKRTLSAREPMFHVAERK